jgi:hypothetical protein
MRREVERIEAPELERAIPRASDESVPAYTITT